MAALVSTPQDEPSVLLATILGALVPVIVAVLTMFVVLALALAPPPPPPPHPANATAVVTTKKPIKRTLMLCLMAPPLTAQFNIDLDNYYREHMMKNKICQEIKN
jgi:hypothetical protein